MSEHLTIMKELVTMVDHTKLTPKQIDRFFEIRLIVEQENLRHQLEYEKAEVLKDIAFLVERRKGQKEGIHEKTCKQCGHVWRGRVENPASCPVCHSRRWDKDKKEPELEPDDAPQNAFCTECNSLLSGKNSWRCSNPKCKKYEPLRDVVWKEDGSHTKLVAINKFCTTKCGELSDELTDILLDHLKLIEKEQNVGTLMEASFPKVIDLIKQDIASRGIPWDEKHQKKRVNATVSNIMKRVVRWLNDGQEPENINGGHKYVFDDEYYFIVRTSDKGHHYSMEKIKNTGVEK